ncbi:MAG: DNA repair protein RecO [Clostridiales bacterium]|nr:DNA repair protein RecO [Candidatus Equinaster intestinalis]
MQITDQALVIKVTDIGENDRLITLLTRDYGVIKAFASGAKKLKNKYHAGSSFLCYSSFIIEEVKDTYRVRDASLLKCYYKTGNDITEIALLQYFCELAAVLIPSGTESREALKLLLKSIITVNEKRMAQPLIKSVFELRLMSLLGFMPDLVACNSCGNFTENTMCLDILGGVLYCKDCAEPEKTVPLSSTLLAALRHIVFSEFEKLFSFSIPENHFERLSYLTEKYLLSCAEHNFKTLEFYKSFKEF